VRSLICEQLATALPKVRMRSGSTFLAGRSERPRNGLKPDPRIARRRPATWLPHAPARAGERQPAQRLATDRCHRTPSVAIERTFAYVRSMTSPTPAAGAAVYVPALRLRAEMRHLEGTERLGRIRSESPKLLEAADEIVAALDCVDPPRPVPRCGECDDCTS